MPTMPPTQPMPHLPIDNAAHLAQKHRQSQQGSLVLSIMLSILVHGLVLLVLIYFQQPPNIPTHTIQAELVSANVVADIEAKIRDGVATLGSSDASNDKDTTQMSANQSADFNQDMGQPMGDSASMLPQNDSINNNDANQIFIPAPNTMTSDTVSDNQVQKSEAMLEYERRLLEKESAYLAQQQAFAAQLDAQIMAEMQQQRDKERQRLQEQQQTVNDYKRIEQSSHHITASNKEQSETANQAKQEKNRPSSIASLKDGQATITLKSGGGSHQSHGSTQSNSSALSAIKAKVQAHFSPPINTQGERSVLVITVAQDGTVLDVSVSGSHSALNDAAKTAVYAASPLPIDPNNPKTYPTIRIGLTGTS